MTHLSVIVSRSQGKLKPPFITCGKFEKCKILSHQCFFFRSKVARTLSVTIFFAHEVEPRSFSFQLVLNSLPIEICLPLNLVFVYSF